MSIAHQMRAQRQIAAQEKKSLWLGSTIFGCSMLAVVGAVALVVVNRGAAQDQDELAEGSSEDFEVTSTVGQARRRAGVANLEDAYRERCKQNMKIGAIGAMAMGSPQFQGERGREVGRKMIDGSMCDEAFAAMRQMRDIHRTVNSNLHDDQ